MLFKITMTYPETRKGSRITPAREKIVTKDFPNSPLLPPNKRGFMGALQWAQSEFPGAKVSLTTITNLPAELSPALAAELKK
jgi:hypothetical protein